MRPELAPPPPKRGELYIAGLDPVVGHEQSGRRPFLVLSIAAVNDSPLELAIGLPVTSTPHGSKLHVRIEPGHTGLSRVSYAMPEMVRSVSTERFGRSIGRVSTEVFELAANRTGLLLGLGRTKF